jgi:hypothetical protein
MRGDALEVSRCRTQGATSLAFFLWTGATTACTMRTDCFQLTTMQLEQLVMAWRMSVTIQELMDIPHRPKRILECLFSLTWSKSHLLACNLSQRQEKKLHPSEVSML